MVDAGILVPETEPIPEALTVPKEKTGFNFFDVPATGTMEGLQPALNVGTMLMFCRRND